MWGLGRHYLGSNFFWYLKDPAGNFSEYFSDLDCIIDDELWEPGVGRGERPVRLGATASAVIPQSGGSRRLEDTNPFVALAGRACTHL